MGVTPKLQHHSPIKGISDPTLGFLDANLGFLGSKLVGGV